MSKAGNEAARKHGMLSLEERAELAVIASNGLSSYWYACKRLHEAGYVVTGSGTDLFDRFVEADIFKADAIRFLEWAQNDKSWEWIHESEDGKEVTATLAQEANDAYTFHRVTDQEDGTGLWEVYGDGFSKLSKAADTAIAYKDECVKQGLALSA